MYMSNKNDYSYEDRQAEIRNFTIYISAFIGLFSGYVLGYAGHYMNNTRISFIDALLKAVASIREGHLFYKPSITSLKYMIYGVIIGLIAFFLINNDNKKNATYKMTAIAGTGRYMNKSERKEYEKEYIFPDPPAFQKYPVPKEDWTTLYEKYSKNMILGNWFCRPNEARLIYGNNNILVVGGAGSGKSRFFVKPNILQMNASYVITDPSGELVSSLGSVLRDNGYKVRIFNLTDMQHSNCYNPLHYIRDEKDVDKVIDCFQKNSSMGETSGDNKFFEEAEKLLYEACIHYLVTYCNNESMKNFSGVTKLVNASSVDEKNPNNKSKLDQLFDELPKDSIARYYYVAFKQAAGKTLKSIIISCIARLRPFITPQVANLTRTDEMYLDRIGEERTAIFIIIPQADTTHNFLASMLYSQLFDTLYNIGDTQKANGEDERLKIPVRCIMDEFANIGEVPRFDNILSTCRKYNISASVILQDLSQIESIYDEIRWRTIVANCSTKLFLGSVEKETLKWFSEMLGEETARSKSTSISKGGKGGSNDSFQYTGRAVETPEELGRLNLSKCLIYTQGMRTVKDRKYKYERHPYYKQTADYNKKYAFKYNKLSIYDNSKAGNYVNIYIAMNEANRVAKMDKEKVKSVGNKDIVDPNSVTLTDEQVEKIYQKYMIECSEKALNSFHEPVCMFEISSIPSKYLKRLARMTVDSFHISRNIIFIPMKFKGINEETLLGFGIDLNKSSDQLSLLSCLKKEVANGNCLRAGQKDENIMCVVTRDKFEEFKERINQYY